jgi:hypothetical protein
MVSHMEQIRNVCYPPLSVDQTYFFSWLP